MGASKYTDTAGNDGSGGSAPAITFDTKAPTLTITRDQSVLKKGQTSTITFTFSEDPGSTFAWDGSTGDVSVTGGTLGTLSTVNGTTRTAIFTPTDDMNSGSASISVGASKYTDTAGNDGSGGSAPAITFDTKAPTLTITRDQSVLKKGQTSTITFTFSEDPGSTFAWDGSTGDVSVTGGTLGTLSTVNGTTRTAIFTPTDDTNSGSASISVGASKYTDTAGNDGSGGSAPAINFDTKAPNITANPSLTLMHNGTTATTALVTGDTVVLTIPLGEAATGLAGLPTTGSSNGTIIKFGNTAKAGARWSISGNNLVLTYTVVPGDSGAISVDPDALKTALGNSITDTAGNPATLGSGVWSNSTSVFTAPASPSLMVSAPAAPTVSSFVVSDTVTSNGANLGKGGEAVSVDVTFSEAVTLSASSTYTVHVQIGSNVSDGFDAIFSTGLNAPTAINHYTFSGTLPSTAGLSTNALQLTALTVPAGASIVNAGAQALTQSSYTLSSNAYTVDTTAPSVTSVAFDGKSDTTHSGLKQGEWLDVAVTFSEAVNITGSPRIALTIGAGNATRHASYNSSDSRNTAAASTTKYFRYTVQAGDTDADGVSIATNALSLNGGSITDPAGNAAAAITHALVADNTTYTIDTTAPAAPTLNLGVGVLGGATAAEAKANTGVVTVVSDNDTTVVAHFVGKSGSFDKTAANGAVVLNDADLTTLGQGTVTVTATATDAVGNSTSTTSPTTFNLDTIAPTLSTATVSGTTLTLRFSEALSSTGDTPAIADFNLSDGTTVSAVSVNNSGDVVLTLSQNLAAGSTLSYTGSAGHMLHDAAGNPVANISSQAVAGGFINLGTVLSDPANATKALDVTSDLVFTLPASFTGTLEAGTGDITITHNGYQDGLTTGYQGQTAASKHSFTIPVNSTLVSISGTGANTTITISPDAHFDFDLSSNYSVSIPAGAFTASGASSAALTASFKTVVPGTVTAPTPVDSGTVTGSFSGTLAYRMNSSGALVASNKWVNVDGLGRSEEDASVSLDLSGGDYTVVFHDSSSAATNVANSTTGIAPTTDLAVLLKNFDAADRIYVDDQFHNAANLNQPTQLGGEGSGTAANPLHIALNQPANGGTDPYIDIVFASGATTVTPNTVSPTVATWNPLLFTDPTNPYNSLVIGG